MHSCIMQYVKDIFESFGGNSAIKDITGEKYPTVASWIQRCSIPAKHWPALVAAARERGLPVTFEVLAHVASNGDHERALREGQVA